MGMLQREILFKDRKAFQYCEATRTYSCLICYIISLECISRLRFGYGSSEFVINVFAVSVFYCIHLKDEIVFVHLDRKTCR